jgi:hypothetical protein
VVSRLDFLAILDLLYFTSAIATIP